MLYVSTRNNGEEFTANKALCDNTAMDGGWYVPFRIPAFDAVEIRALKDKTFNQTIADILNLFFSARITAWDVDCCIGRNVCKLHDMTHKIIVAELWHNVDSRYSYIAKSLYAKLCGNLDREPSGWFLIALRIAVLFGVYGELLKGYEDNTTADFDLSIPTGDMTVTMAAWYARKMGLPLNTIICTSEESSVIWDLIHRGSFLPQNADERLQCGTELLIHAVMGSQQADLYRSCCDSGKQYMIKDDVLKNLDIGIFCSVAGQSRADSTINSVYRSNQYIFDPLTALCYGGLQDYRAKTGESRTTVLLIEENPLHFASDIERATGINLHNMNEFIHHS